MISKLTDNTSMGAPNGKTHRVKAEMIVLGVVLLGFPLLLMALKLFPWQGASAMAGMFSLSRLPLPILPHVQRLMLMSLGAVIVVIFRLTLGIRVLGPVRPILIALAYQLTGFVVGTVFLVSVMIIIAMIRPLLRSAGMPYFARIAIVLSLVALMVLIVLEIGLAIGMDECLRVGLLPVVVLTFAAEGFAKTLYKEGLKSAVWRALMTIIVAVLIYELTNFPGMHEFVLRFPELLLIQIGLIYLVGRCCKFHALEFVNPKPKPRKSRTGKRTRRKVNQEKHVPFSDGSSLLLGASNANLS
ncbi:MAG: 7TM domain-containing protein [bacterium]